jgi:hypothetical protein
MSFSGYFVGFSCAACSFDSEVFVFGFLCEDHGYVLCIFVLDLDPSNSGFCLHFEDFAWNPGFLVELGLLSITSDLVCLRLQVFGYSIPKGCFTSSPNLFSIHAVVWEIHGGVEGVDFVSSLFLGLFVSYGQSVVCSRTIREVTRSSLFITFIQFLLARVSIWCRARFSLQLVYG